MKAILVKDDEFNTIGLTVYFGTGANQVAFRWGISPTEFNFTKHLDVSKIESEIFQLIELNAELRQLEHFWSDFARTADTIEELHGKSYQCSFDDNKREIEHTRNRIERIIKAFK